MEPTVFRQLMRWLWDKHEDPWLYTDPEAKEIYGRIARVYPSFETPEELLVAASTPADKNMKPRRRFLYLNPVRHGPLMVPVISVHADFDRSHPEVRLRMLLFLLEDGELRTIGFRFEAPEGPGRHNFYHAQLIKGFEKDDDEGASIPWLPTKEPTLCLDANGPVQLLLTLLIGLYGLTYVSSVRTALRGTINHYLDDMRFAALAPRYWRVTHGSETQYYKTWNKNFRARMRAKYTDFESVAEITPDEYFAQHNRWVD